MQLRYKLLQPIVIFDLVNAKESTSLISSTRATGLLPLSQVFLLASLLGAELHVTEELLWQLIKGLLHIIALFSAIAELNRLDNISIRAFYRIVILK